MTDDIDDDLVAIRHQLASVSTAHQRIHVDLDELCAALGDTRAEVRAELAHLQQSVRAETGRLRHETAGQLAVAGSEVVSQLSAVGHRLLATALAGQLAAVTVLVLVLLATGAGP